MKLVLKQMYVLESKYKVQKQRFVDSVISYQPIEIFLALNFNRRICKVVF